MQKCKSPHRFNAICCVRGHKTRNVTWTYCVSYFSSRQIKRRQKESYSPSGTATVPLLISHILINSCVDLTNFLYFFIISTTSLIIIICPAPVQINTFISPLSLLEKVRVKNRALLFQFTEERWPLPVKTWTVKSSFSPHNFWQQWSCACISFSFTFSQLPLFRLRLQHIWLWIVKQQCANKDVCAPADVCVRTSRRVCARTSALLCS